MAASSVAPLERLKAPCTAGTSTIMPTRPYTTEGMPAKSSTALRMMRPDFFPAYLDRNMAVNRPNGKPTTRAPRVPYTLVRMKGRTPNWSLPGFHT